MLARVSANMDTMPVKKVSNTVRGMRVAEPYVEEPIPERPLGMTCPPPSSKQLPPVEDDEEPPPSMIPGARAPRDVPKRRDTAQGIPIPAVHASAPPRRRSTRPPPSE